LLLLSIQAGNITPHNPQNQNRYSLIKQMEQRLFFDTLLSKDPLLSRVRFCFRFT
jgi:hypothetical protein